MEEGGRETDKTKYIHIIRKTHIIYTGTIILLNTKCYIVRSAI